MTGGWVAASPYHRLTALTRTDPAATMSNVGCMDLVEETLGVLMLDYLSEEVESVRFRQKARIKEQQESRCDFDGKPGRSTVSIAAAASTEARRRLSRAAEATHPQAGSRRGRRQLKETRIDSGLGNSQCRWQQRWRRNRR